MIETVGIIGAGQMGTGIAQVLARANRMVLLVDVSDAASQEGLAKIGKNLDRLIAKGKMDDLAKKEALARIIPVTDYAKLADCQLVIEAATENEAVKKQIFAQLCPVLPPETLIATNTSSISITRLGTATDRPGKFMGMHFMKPAPVMQLVELIRGIATAEETFSAVRNLVTDLGKTAVASEDFPAFIVNRVLLPMINEAIYTLYEGVGSVAAIDAAMRLGANHPMGPLELADFIGLDTCLAIIQVLYEGLADSKYRLCPLLVKYVEAGWVGQKVGRGFYDYGGETPIPTR